MARPRIFSVSMVKNEADIIETFVRYHSNLLDGMLILDHSSSDHTPDILKNLMSEGLPLFLSSSPAGEFDQKGFVTQLVYKAFHSHHADLVLPLDADEFLVAVDRSHTNPRQILDDLPRDTISKAFWRTFFPHDSDDAAELNVLKRLRFRTDQLAPGLESARNKIFIPRDIALRRRLHLGHGSHKLDNRRRFRQRIPHQDLDTLKIAHFPIRSFSQACSKIFVGWINSLALPNLGSQQGAHWGRLFERLKTHNGDLTLRDVQLLTAIAYLHTDDLSQVTLDLDPVDLSFCPPLELRYTTSNEVNLLRNIVENAESLATNFAKLRRNSCSVSQSAATCATTTFKSVESLLLGEILGMQPKNNLYHW